MVSILAHANLIYIFGFADDANIIGSHIESIVKNTVQNEAKAIELTFNDHKTKVNESLLNNNRDNNVMIKRLYGIKNTHVYIGK